MKNLKNIIIACFTIALASITTSLEASNPVHEENAAIQA